MQQPGRELHQTVERLDSVVMARSKTNPNAWTPNQIVAYRVAMARRLRGWTQEQSAIELEPFLGTRLSSASFSAIERSFTGGRIRQFNADELLALSRGFRLSIGWFFTPPPVMDEIGVRTPDEPKIGWEPMLLIDAILGTPETIEAWEGELRLWPLGPTIMRVYDDGRTELRSRDVPDVHERLDTQIRAQTAVRIGQLLGDTDRAKEVLTGIINLLEDLDETDENNPE